MSGTTTHKATARTNAYQAVIEKMYQAPNRWFKVGVYGTTGSAGVAAYLIRNGRGLKAFVGKSGQFESVVRKDLEVWARFVGKTTATKKRKRK